MPARSADLFIREAASALSAASEPGHLQVESHVERFDTGGQGGVACKWQVSALDGEARSAMEPSFVQRLTGTRTAPPHSVQLGRCVLGLSIRE